MNAPSFEFRHETAVRKKLGYMIGAIAPSGGGKTCSMLRVATGARRVLGGKVFFIDTQGTQSVQYAPAEGERVDPPRTFDFERVEMAPPYRPNAFGAAMEHCVSSGARIVIVDSMSDEHEGEGGILEMQDDEWGRLGRKDSTKFLSWVAPKRERNKLIGWMRRQNVLFLLCFRAKESLKIQKGKEPERDGWVWIGGDQYAYEMPLRLLFLPGADGVPTLMSSYPGERLSIRTPTQFRSLMESHKGPIDESIGEEIARWMEGGSPPTRGTKPAPDHLTPEDKRDAVLAAIEVAPDIAALDELRKRGGPRQYADEIRAAFDARAKELANPENFDR